MKIGRQNYKNILFTSNNVKWDRKAALCFYTPSSVLSRRFKTSAISMESSSGSWDEYDWIHCTCGESDKDHRQFEFSLHSCILRTAVSVGVIFCLTCLMGTSRHKACATVRSESTHPSQLVTPVHRMTLVSKQSKVKLLFLITTSPSFTQSIFFFLSTKAIKTPKPTASKFCVPKAWYVVFFYFIELHYFTGSIIFMVLFVSNWNAQNFLGSGLSWENQNEL